MLVLLSSFFFTLLFHSFTGVVSLRHCAAFLVALFVIWLEAKKSISYIMFVWRVVEWLTLGMNNAENIYFILKLFKEEIEFSLKNYLCKTGHFGRIENCQLGFGQRRIPPSLFIGKKVKNIVFSMNFYMYL